MQSGTVPGAAPRYARRVILIDPADTAARVKRIDQLIDEYLAAKRRRLLRRAKKLWREAERRQRLAGFEVPPERVH